MSEFNFATISYIFIGAFGFLSTKTTSDGSGLTGNYGFKDQQMAMRWTKENIYSFGGDPNKVCFS